MKKITHFYMGEFLTTKAQWDAIAGWARENGYTDLAIGRNVGREPVGNVSWYDALKFCNAASELAGLQPCYLLEDGSVYRTGFCDDPVVAGNGYRLPTSAEWEIACRAGTTTDYYWGDSLDAKYGWFTTGITQDYSIHDVGLLEPNGYGLYDMSGNACEWCIDRAPGARRELRIQRGGSVALDAVLTSSFEAVTGPEYYCYETSLRPITENPDAPDLEDLAKTSAHWGKEYIQPVLYPAMDDKSTAIRLARALADTEFGLSVKKLVAEEKYTEALDAYKARYIEIVGPRAAGYADIKPGSASTAIIDAFPKGSAWFGEAHTINKPGPEQVAMACAANLDKGYLKQFTEYLEDLLVRQKAEYDVLSPEMFNTKQSVPQVWLWFMGFDNSTQAFRLSTALSIACGSGMLKDVSSALVAQASLFMIQESVYTMLKDYRMNVPNQKVHVMKILYTLASLHPDFRLYTPIMDMASEILSGHFDKVIYPDGTCLEQAFNYNGSIIRDFLALISEFPDIKVPESAAKKVNYLSRMLDVVAAPVADFPAVGTCGFIAPPDIRNPEVRSRFLRGLLHSHVQYDLLIMALDPTPEQLKERPIPNRWADYRRLIHCFQGDMSDTPKFNCVYFPYNAQAVIRSGYNWDDKYLFFFAPRKGSGHAVENVNDIFFIDYGRPFLINAGGGSYGMLDWIPEDQREYIGEIDGYQHSSAGRNVVLVDGTSQSRLKDGDSCVLEQYPNTAGNKYYNDDELLYVEGNYADGYYAGDDVHHQREIFYHKKSGLFFIIDNLTGSKEHTYTQNWNIMPYSKEPSDYDIGLPGTDMTWGFTNEEVIVDKANTTIYTAQKDAPNLFLYQFSTHDLTYSRNYGDLHPALGWFSASLPGRRHPKPDIHTHWTAPAGTSSVLTVMATAPTEHSRVSSIEKVIFESVSGCDIVMEDGQKLTFRFAPEATEMDVNGKKITARAVLLQDDSGIVMSGDTNYVLKNGEKIADILAPTGFEWIDKDGYSYPSYTY